MLKFHACKHFYKTCLDFSGVLNDIPVLQLEKGCTFVTCLT